MKQQRMILTDSMLNLHSDFLKKNPSMKLSYSSFCTLRPFYVTAPKASDRSTCLCHHHENADLMLQVLRSSGALKSTKLEDSFQLVCCTFSHLFMVQNKACSSGSREKWNQCSMEAVGASSRPNSQWDPLQHETQLA